MTIHQKTITVEPDNYEDRIGVATVATQPGAKLIAAQVVIPPSRPDDPWAVHVRAAIDADGVVTVQTFHHSLAPVDLLISVEVDA